VERERERERTLCLQPSFFTLTGWEEFVGHNVRWVKARNIGQGHVQKGILGLLSGQAEKVN
jgi:hypothetical protein